MSSRLRSAVFLLGFGVAAVAGILTRAEWLLDTAITVGCWSWLLLPREPQGSLLGPHFGFELMRLARRPRWYLCRAAYLLTLSCLLVLQAPHLLSFSHYLTLNESANIGSGFTYQFFVVQNLAILMLGPVFVGPVLAEERERGTADLLRISALSRREIVLGKAAARIVHLASFVLLGLPFLALIHLLGGVDMTLVLSNFIYSLMLVVTVGSVCVWMSSLCDRTTDALRLSVGMLIVLVALNLATCCWAGFGLVLVDRSLNPWSVCVIENLPRIGAAGSVVSVLSLYAAMVMFRVQNLSSKQAMGERTLRRPTQPVWDHGLLWKECHAGADLFHRRPEFGLLLAIAPPAIVVGLMMNGVLTSDGGFVLLMSIYYGALGLYFLGATLRATATVARERQQQTLDLLLQIPWERSEILKAKWFGCVFRGWPWLLLASTSVLTCGLLGPISLSMAFSLILHALITAYLLTIAGLCFSVRCQTVLQANLAMVVACLIAYATGIGFVEMMHFIMPLMTMVDPKKFGDPKLEPLFSFGFLFVHAMLSINVGSLFHTRAFQRFEDRDRMSAPS